MQTNSGTLGLSPYPANHIRSFIKRKGGLKSESVFINVPNHGKRKVRYQKNGRPYVIVNKKKLKL